jgi:hypothetical protein
MFRPLFPEHFCMMVKLDLVRLPVQPFLEINWAASYELRATSKQKLWFARSSRLRARSSYTELREAFGEWPGL